MKWVLRSSFFHLCAQAKYSTIRYLFLYLLMLKSFLVYISDIFTATTMLTTDGWSNDIYNSCPADDDTEDCVPIDFNIGKWVFFGCIIFSFLLVGDSHA
jgi:hypothetical protein